VSVGIVKLFVRVELAGICLFFDSILKTISTIARKRQHCQRLTAHLEFSVHHCIFKIAISQDS
jgi:hypothetical protein